MFDQSLGPADRQILRAILAAQERTLTDIQELIKMTDALQTAVADLQATDATLVTAVNAFIANAVGTLQQQLAAAQAALAAVQAQDATDQANLAAAQKEIADAGATIETEVTTLKGVVASVTPAPAPTPAA